MLQGTGVRKLLGVDAFDSLSEARLEVVSARFYTTILEKRIVLFVWEL
jgi:hypothetical protein